MDTLEFQIGEKVMVEFILDDTHQSLVTKDMIVKNRTTGVVVCNLNFLIIMINMELKNPLLLGGA